MSLDESQCAALLHVLRREVVIFLALHRHNVKRIWLNTRDAANVAIPNRSIVP